MVVCLFSALIKNLYMANGKGVLAVVNTTRGLFGSNQNGEGDIMKEESVF